jgi:thiol-disulfide isomerase/thioredoxin
MKLLKFSTFFTIRNIAIFGVLLLLIAILVKPSNENFAVNDKQPSHQQPKSTLKCIMFFTEWCGYCKKAKPEWERLRVEMDGKVVADKRIVITGVDCDKDEATAKRYGINAFPTFKFEIDGQVLDYSGENTFDGFKRFIQSI